MKASLITEDIFTLKIGDAEFKGLQKVGEWEGMVKLQGQGQIAILFDERSSFMKAMDATVFGSLAKVGPTHHIVLASKAIVAKAQELDAGANPGLARAARDVLVERRRQVDLLGYDHHHDDDHANDEIAALAAIFAMPAGARDWDATSSTYGPTFAKALLPEGWSMPAMGQTRRDDLVKGAALLLAEIERLDRVAATTGGAG